MSWACTAEYATPAAAARTVSSVRSFGCACVLSQIIGSVFVYTSSLLQLLRRSVVTSVRSRYLFTGAVALVVGFLSWTAAYTRSQDRPIINELFSSKGLARNGTEPTDALPTFERPSRFLGLIIYTIIKFVTTTLTIALPIPCGIVMPLLALGASSSRLFGEVSNLFIGDATEAGVYAMAGAAGLVAAVTHTISPCVVVVEITAQANNMLPLLVTTVTAYAFAGLFTVSIYDVMMEIGRLPYLPRVQNSALYSLRAKDVMHKDFSFLTLSSTFNDAFSLLSQRKFSFEDSATVPQFPLVDSAESMVFLGCVSRTDLERFVLRDPRLMRHIRGIDEGHVGASDGIEMTTRVHGGADSATVSITRAVRAASGLDGDALSVSLIDSPTTSPPGSYAPAPAGTVAGVASPLASDGLEWLRETLPFKIVLNGELHTLRTDTVHDSNVASAAATPRADAAAGRAFRGNAAGVSAASASTSEQDTGAGVGSIALAVAAVSLDDVDDDTTESSPLPARRASRVNVDYVPVEPAPFQLPELTAMSLLHYLFAICMYSRMYITRRGRLVGIAFKGDFLSEKWLPNNSDVQ